MNGFKPCIVYIANSTSLIQHPLYASVFVSLALPCGCCCTGLSSSSCSSHRMSSPSSTPHPFRSEEEMVMDLRMRHMIDTLRQAGLAEEDYSLPPPSSSPPVPRTQPMHHSSAGMTHAFTRAPNTTGRVSDRFRSRNRELSSDDDSLIPSSSNSGVRQRAERGSFSDEESGPIFAYPAPDQRSYASSTRSESPAVVHQNPYQAQAQQGELLAGSRSEADEARALAMRQVRPLFLLISLSCM